MKRLATSVLAAFALICTPTMTQSSPIDWGHHVFDSNWLLYFGDWGDHFDHLQRQIHAEIDVDEIGDGQAHYRLFRFVRLGDQVLKERYQFQDDTLLHIRIEANGLDGPASDGFDCNLAINSLTSSYGQAKIQARSSAKGYFSAQIGKVFVWKSPDMTSTISLVMRSDNNCDSINVDPSV